MGFWFTLILSLQNKELICLSIKCFKQNRYGIFRIIVLLESKILTRNGWLDNMINICSTKFINTCFCKKICWKFFLMTILKVSLDYRTYFYGQSNKKDECLGIMLVICKFGPLVLWFSQFFIMIKKFIIVRMISIFWWKNNIFELQKRRFKTNLTFLGKGIFFLNFKRKVTIFFCKSFGLKKWDSFFINACWVVYENVIWFGYFKVF